MLSKYFIIPVIGSVNDVLEAFLPNPWDMDSCLRPISAPLLLHRILSYLILWYHIISYLSYHITSYHIISYHIILYYIISYHIISCRVQSYSMKFYSMVWYGLIWYQMSISSPSETNKSLWYIRSNFLTAADSSGTAPPVAKLWKECLPANFFNKVFNFLKNNILAYRKLYLLINKKNQESCACLKIEN